MKVSKTMLLSTAAGLFLSLTANSVSAHHVNEEQHFKVTAQTETDPVASGDDARMTRPFGSMKSIRKKQVDHDK